MKGLGHWIQGDIERLLGEGKKLARRVILLIPQTDRQQHDKDSEESSDARWGTEDWVPFLQLPEEEGRLHSGILQPGSPISQPWAGKRVGTRTCGHLY